MNVKQRRIKIEPSITLNYNIHIIIIETAKPI